MEAYRTMYPWLRVADSLPLGGDGIVDDDGTMGVTSDTSDGNQVVEGHDGTIDRRWDGTMVVWPECWTHLMDSLHPPHSPHHSHNTIQWYHQTCIWWLSVDNNGMHWRVVVFHVAYVSICVWFWFRSFWLFDLERFG